ncbi:uncharacterized protein V6R79_014917 [Siganus canaliculatus]
MDFGLATFAALVMLFAAASCAPAGLHDACEDVRRSSLALNHVARRVSMEARSGSKVVTNFPSKLSWMEAKDMCDPQALKDKSAPCTEKMLSVLTSYNTAVERVSGFQSCSKFVSEVKPAMQKLHQDMTKCVKSRNGRTQQMGVSNEEAEPVARWQEDLLCHYTLDRLFSFSILTARVFAVGDPAHHTDGSAPKCSA